VILNLLVLAAHLFCLKILVAHLWLIKTKILLLMVIYDEINTVFYISSEFQDLAAHLCVAAHRLRNKGLLHQGVHRAREGLEVQGVH